MRVKVGSNVLAEILSFSLTNVQQLKKHATRKMQINLKSFKTKAQRTDNNK